MTQRKKVIRTEAYVRIGEKVIPAEELSEEARAQLALQLLLTFLNKAYEGEAEFKAEQT